MKIFLLLLFIPWLASSVEFGHKKYVEYIPGDLPIIIAAPHGGRLLDKTIADRTKGTLVTDTNTDKLARRVFEGFEKSFGKKPHLIICHLKRIKVDCNRSRQMCCEGDKQALQVWEDFQGFIEKAKKSIQSKGQKVLFIDLHAHGHQIQRLELGYLLRGSDLAKDDVTLNKMENKSSIRGMHRTFKFNELIRGEYSLGTLMENEGFPSVPSLKQQEPGKGNKYFSGGYNTVEHGAVKSTNCFAIQIETNFKGVRDSEANRKKFGLALAKCLNSYYKMFLTKK